MYIPIFSIVQNDSRFSGSFKTTQEFKEEINEGKISAIDSNIFWNDFFTSRKNILPVECVIYFLPSLDLTS